MNLHDLKIQSSYLLNKPLRFVIGLFYLALVPMSASAYEFRLVGTSHANNPGAQTISPDAKYVAGAQTVYRFGIPRQKCFVWNTSTGLQNVDIATTNSSSCNVKAVSNGKQVLSVLRNLDRNVMETMVWNESQVPRVLWDDANSDALALASKPNADVIVGKRLFGNAYIWNQNRGFQDLRREIISSGQYVFNWRFPFAYGVSDSGRFVVGIGRVNSLWGSRHGAYIWDRNGGFSSIVDLSYTALYDVSNQGSAVGFDHSASGPRAVLVKGNTKTVIGDFSGGIYNSKANAISSDGRVVVGYGHKSVGKTAFYWTRELGLRDIGNTLKKGGKNLGDWRLIEANAVSGSGSRIVGIAQNSQGLKRAFVASVPTYVSSGSNSSTETLPVTKFIDLEKYSFTAPD